MELKKKTRKTYVKGKKINSFKDIIVLQTKKQKPRGRYIQYKYMAGLSPEEKPTPTNQQQWWPGCKHNQQQEFTETNESGGKTQKDQNS